MVSVGQAETQLVQFTDLVSSDTTNEYLAFAQNANLVYAWDIDPVKIEVRINGALTLSFCADPICSVPSTMPKFTELLIAFTFKWVISSVSSILLRLQIASS